MKSLLLGKVGKEGLGERYSYLVLIQDIGVNQSSRSETWGNHLISKHGEIISKHGEIISFQNMEIINGQATVRLKSQILEGIQSLGYLI